MADEVVEETQWAQEGDESEVEENGDIQISDNTQEDMNLSSLAPQTSGDLVCRLLLEKKNTFRGRIHRAPC